MLKRAHASGFRLVRQPDHAALAGYFAAHWGNDVFRPVGHWDETAEPDRLRREIVFGVAEHDNGWWEWEADPEIDQQDGLPLDFLQTSDDSGFARWNRGAARFEVERPYASLLISRHAYWLQTARVAPISEPQFRHPLFGSGAQLSAPQSDESANLRQFLIERLSHERVLLDRVASRGRFWPRALRDATLLPAVRTLQVLDALSLAVCGGGPDEPLQLLEVPRRGWGDRVRMVVQPVSGSRVVLEPYPFDLDPLPFAFPAVLAVPGAWLHARTTEIIGLAFASM